MISFNDLIQEELYTSICFIGTIKVNDILIGGKTEKNRKYPMSSIDPGDEVLRTSAPSCPADIVFLFHFMFVPFLQQLQVGD